MFVTAQEYEDYQQEQGSLILHWMLSEIGWENVHERDPDDHRMPCHTCEQRAS